MKAPLVNKEQRRQKAFTFAAQVVINDKAGIQDRADEPHQGGGEIGRISPNQGNGKAKTEHCQGQQGHGHGGVVTISRRDQKHYR